MLSAYLAALLAAVSLQGCMVRVQAGPENPRKHTRNPRCLVHGHPRMPTECCEAYRAFDFSMDHLEDPATAVSRWSNWTTAVSKWSSTAAQRAVLYTMGSAFSKNFCAKQCLEQSDYPPSPAAKVAHLCEKVQTLLPDLGPDDTKKALAVEPGKEPAVDAPPVDAPPVVTQKSEDSVITIVPFTPHHHPDPIIIPQSPSSPQETGHPKLYEQRLERARAAKPVSRRGPVEGVDHDQLDNRDLYEKGSGTSQLSPPRKSAPSSPTQTVSAGTSAASTPTKTATQDIAVSPTPRSRTMYPMEHLTPDHQVLQRLEGRLQDLDSGDPSPSGFGGSSVLQRRQTGDGVLSLVSSDKGGDSIDTFYTADFLSDLLDGDDILSSDKVGESMDSLYPEELLANLREIVPEGQDLLDGENLDPADFPRDSPTGDFLIQHQ